MKAATSRSSRKRGRPPLTDCQRGRAVYLPTDFLATARKLAELHGRPLSWEIRAALIAWEERHRAELARAGAAAEGN